MCDVSENRKQYLRVIAQYKGFSLLFIELKQSSYTRPPLPCFSISLCLPLFHAFHGTATTHGGCTGASGSLNGASRPHRPRPWRSSARSTLSTHSAFSLFSAFPCFGPLSVCCPCFSSGSHRRHGRPPSRRLHPLRQSYGPATSSSLDLNQAYLGRWDFTTHEET